MKSPFPGMDPYLELHWRSVHHRLVTYAADQLQAVVPRRFHVDVEERVFVTADIELIRSIYPDVHVVDRRGNGASAESQADVAVATPVVVELTDEPLTETYLEIRDTTSGDKVVTAIEFVSPTNKLAGDGNDLFVSKQREYRAAGVSQVEIDLTRQGNRSLVFPVAQIPPQHRATFLTCVRRSWQPARLEVYPMPLDRPLLPIGIPLTVRTTDVRLDLQGLVDQCYRKGRYSDSIDYKLALQPPLPRGEAKWVDRLLRSRRRR